MIPTIFKQTFWWINRYDGRRKEFKGISREQFMDAKSKHYERERASFGPANTTKVEWFKTIARYFAQIPYEMPDGELNDYDKYQRPSSNGVGYVAVCPGERANNFYVDDPILVKYLNRKYNEWKTNKH